MRYGKLGIKYAGEYGQADERGEQFFLPTEVTSILYTPTAVRRVNISSLLLNYLQISRLRIGSRKTLNKKRKHDYRLRAAFTARCDGNQNTRQHRNIV